jgi:glucan biosynthesis protein
MQRRDFLKASAALAAAGFPTQSLLAAAAAPSPLPFLGQAQPFDYARLKGRARALAAHAYHAPERTIPDQVGKLDWDQRLRAPDEHVPVGRKRPPHHRQQRLAARNSRFRWSFHAAR